MKITLIHHSPDDRPLAHAALALLDYLEKCGGFRIECADCGAREDGPGAPGRMAMHCSVHGHSPGEIRFVPKGGGAP